MRLLPLMIILLVGLFGVKIVNIIEGKEDATSNLFISTTIAQTAQDEEKKPEDKPVEDKENKTEDSKKAETKPEHSKEGKKGENDKSSEIATTKPNEFDCKKSIYSEVDIDILQSLAKRRQALDDWNKEVITKEAILKAAELRVTRKLTELKQLKMEVEKSLDAYNQKENMKISSLVKIYENMKPKDAAKIFEGLDMTILLQVIDRMKEAKAAPILAQMNPDKATELTMEFAKQKKIPTTYSSATQEASPGDVPQAESDSPEEKPA